MSDSKPFIIHPDPSRIKQHPTLLNQVRELSESYESNTTTVDNKHLQQIGSLLWGILALENALELAKEALNNDSILPIIIESDNGLVLSLPWETLHHPEYGFLAQHLEFTLSRRMPKVKKPLAEPECTALRVLLFTSLPDNLTEYERLQTEEEQATVLQTLAEAEQQGRVILEMPDDGRFDTFKTTLNEFKPHIVYLSGHGKFEHEHHNNKAWGVFEFEDQWGDRLAVIEDDLCDSLINSSVQAVVLSACQSAKQHKDYPDNGLAQSLHTAGIPHVIGMRESVYDDAGIAFSKAFFGALTQQLPIDQALQQARIAIMAMPKSHSADEHWCLPCQFSQNLNHPLIDWSFKAIPRTQTQTIKETLNGISLPSRFIGRRRELRQWQNALRRNEISELLIIGAGGMGKTALAGKLLKTLEHDGYIVFGLSVHPDHDWHKALTELELLLKDEFLIKQYQIALGEASTIDTPEDLTQSPTITIDEGKRAQALLDALLRQYDRKFVLLVDNLESVQDKQNYHIKDMILQTWIQVAQEFTNQGLKLILTSRWQLPQWDKNALCILGQPTFTDYLSFIRNLKLPMRFIGNLCRLKEAFKILGGNYRALIFFATATKNIKLIDEQVFLNTLSTVTTNIQTDLAIEKVYKQLGEQQKKILNLMRVYLYPISIKGVEEVSSKLSQQLRIINSLLEISLLEQYDNPPLQREYMISPLVKNWLDQEKIKTPSQQLYETAALFMLRQVKKGEKNNWQHILNTHNMLARNNLEIQANHLVLKYIITPLSNAGQYNTLLKKWLPDLLKSKDKSIHLSTLNHVGLQYLSLGDDKSALKYFKKTLKINKKKNNQPGVCTALNNIAQAYITSNNLKKGRNYLEKSLSIAKKIDNKYIEGTALDNISEILRRQGEYDIALNYSKKALNIAKEINDKSGEISALNSMSQTYSPLGENKLALDCLKKSLLISKSTKNKLAESAALNNIGEILYSKGQYDSSLKYFQESLKINKKIGVKGIDAILLTNIAEIFLYKGNYIKADENLKQALKISKIVNSDIIKAEIMNSVSKFYLNRNNQKLSLKYIKKALFLVQESSDNACKAFVLNTAALIYESKMDFNKALEYHNNSLIIFKNIGHKHGEASVLINIANLNKDTIDKPIGLLYKSLEIARKIEDQSTEAIALNNIGHALMLNKNYTDALYFFKKTLLICINIDDLHLRITVLGNISEIYMEQEDYNKSINCLEKALMIADKINDSTSKEEVYIQMSNIYKIQGYYDRALIWENKCLALVKENRNKNKEATRLNNIGHIYLDQGLYDTAIIYLIQSYDILKKSDDKQTESLVLANIAHIYIKQHEYDLSCNFLLKALEIQEKITPFIINPDKAGIMNLMGVCLIKKGDIESAIKYIKIVLDYSTEYNDYPLIEVSLSNMGAIYKEKGLYPTSIDYFIKAMTLRNNKEDKQLFCNVFFHLGDVYWRKKEYIESIEYFTKSFKIAEKSNTVDVINKLNVFLLNNDLPEGQQGWDMLLKKYKL